LSSSPVDVDKRADDEDQCQYADSSDNKCRITNYTVHKQLLQLKFILQQISVKEHKRKKHE